MRAIYTIAKREIRSFFVSPIAYIVLSVWLLLSGFSFYILASWYARNATTGGSDNPLTPFFGGTVLFYIPPLVFVPIITMRLLADERRTGTIEPLLTAPVSDAAVVFGKYIAGILIWISMWIPTLLYVWICSNYGDVDMGVVAASYVGVFCLGLYYMAIGLLMSAVSSNQIVSAVLTFLMLGLLFVLGLFEFVVVDTRDLFSYISVWSHMDAFSKGVVDSRHLVYAASLTVLALVLALGVVNGLRARREPKPARLAIVAPLTFAAALPFAVLGYVHESLWFALPGGLVVAQAVYAYMSRANAYGVLGTMLLCGVILIANHLSYRHYQRWDWTEEGIYTLSDRTERALGELDHDVTIYLFLSAAERNYEDVRELLQRYRAESRRIHVREIDPDRQPGEYRTLVQRFGVRTGELETGEQIADVAAVVESGDRTWRVTHDDLLDLDFGSLEDEEGPRIDVKAERAFTGAILQVTRGRATKICVTSGHGEWTVEGGDRSLYALGDELRRDNIELESIPTLGESEIPESCDAVFVVGPLRPFTEPEADLLTSYVHGGGGLLLALDPIPDRSRLQPSGLETTAAAFGIQIDASLVFEMDRERQLAPSPIDAFYVNDYGEHRSTAAVAAMQAPTVLQVVRSVRAAEGGEATVIMRASEESFALTDLGSVRPDVEPEPGDDDIRGPVPVAVAAEHAAPGAGNDEEEGDESPRGGRIVVVGDSDWLDAQMLQPQFANRDVASSTVGWLTEREALISIAPRTIQAQAIVMTEGDLDGVWLRVIVLIPASILLLGFAVWWQRRS